MKVTVRMYRHGLGDCFLLIFERPQPQRNFYMMIDCGVLQNLKTEPGHPSPPERLAEVVKDIKRETDGDLDLFVMTHEHWDHISGFCYKGSSDAFAGIKIKKVWMSWLENPANEWAQNLEKEENASLTALWQAQNLTRGMGLGAEYSSVWEGVSNLLNFSGPVDPELAGAAGTGSSAAFMPGLAAAGNNGPDSIVRTLRQGRDHIRQCGETSPDYLEPGSVVSLPGVEGVRIYVLGPPDDKKALHSMESTRSEVIYQNPKHSRSLTGDFLAAVATAAKLEIGKDISEDLTCGKVEALQPFGEGYRVLESDLDELRSGQGTLNDNEQYASVDAADYTFFSRNYYGAGRKDDTSWRKIDNDWLLQAGGLALDLDTYTNNTSLVLAIELVESGKVLLFPGDAQRGNWESWERHEWKVGADDARKIDKLLNSTVFYKVGHHGSHNATLSDKGLKLMSKSGLVAMIPVDERQAMAQGSGWLMPAPLLYDALREQALGRVARDDAGIPSEADTLKFSLQKPAYEEFLTAITADGSAAKLYIDYAISD